MKIHANDYRIKDEKNAYLFGMAILVFILLFITAASVGRLTILLLAYTVITVWIFQGQLVGSCAKVSKKQFPEIFSIIEETAHRLDMKSPDVFVKQDPTLNAFAIGFLWKKSVVLHSATIEAMDRGELQHIIGHEFSHIKCGHTNLVVLTNGSKRINIPIVSQVMAFIFLRWSRLAEYTCDRGGLLACRSPRSAIAAMCKLAVGPVLYKDMDIDAFLNQKEEVDSSQFSKVGEKLSTHPYLVKRIQALKDFFDSPEFVHLNRT